MGKERAMVAAATLQRDAGVMLSNLQILSQFAMAFESNVVFDDGIGPRPVGVSGSRSGRSITSTTCAAGGTVYVGHGVVAPSGESICAKTCSDTVV